MVWNISCKYHSRAQSHQDMNMFCCSLRQSLDTLGEMLIINASTVLDTPNLAMGVSEIMNIIGFGRADNDTIVDISTGEDDGQYRDSIVLPVGDICEQVANCSRDGNTTGKHDDVIKWKCLPRFWPFVRGIHRSPVNSPYKGQWRGGLLNKRLSKQSRDLKRHRTHYDVSVMVVTIHKALWS